MTRTVDDVLHDIHSSPHVTGDALLLEAEILALRAERDALRAAARDADVHIGKHDHGWREAHAAVIARAREAGE